MNTTGSLMTFEFTDEFLAILILLEDGKRKNITEVATLLREGYQASKISALKAARQTTASRLKDLHYTGYLDLKKDRSGNVIYNITARGREKIEEKEKNEYMKNTIDNFRELFKTLKLEEE